MMDTAVERAARRYLAQVDQLLPGVVGGFYLVGSVALGAYRPRRSDIDFIAVLESGGDHRDLRRLRLQHARSGVDTAITALLERRSPLTGTLNGVFVGDHDIEKPVTQIRAVASHTGGRFRTDHPGSDLSPVAWKVFAEHGIAIRGPQPSLLGLDPQPELLRSWTAANLESYWRPWASAVLLSQRRPFALRPRWMTAWGVLGAPRLHRTIATGDIISKEAAGEYALEAFSREWHPLIREALAYLREEPDRLRVSSQRRAHLTAQFVVHVIEESRLSRP
jgi:Domain of unknown function (DUF4111)/Nucleotidyltransferase domain